MKPKQHQNLLAEVIMMTEDKLGSSNARIVPRIIIHGGAGNITRKSMSRERYDAYQASLRHILEASAELLFKPGATALDVAASAVSMLEDDPLYNSGKGAVFTSEGKNELECSIMVSNGYRKRGIGCMMLRHVKNPIKLARELLVRGEVDGGDGSQDHCQYNGAFVESLAEKWGLDMVDPSYFFTQQRWDEHKKGLEEKQKQERGHFPTGEMSEWERGNYIPLGTCGAVVLDSFGTICVATSTGGLTNKVPGRIGDTPTIGAGFWAEEWHDGPASHMKYRQPRLTPLDQLSRGHVRSLVADCLPAFQTSRAEPTESQNASSVRRAVGLSGTGNGDSFLRMAACRTAAAKSRFGLTSLSQGVKWMAGPNGELQKSAGDRWKRFHEGTGGIIGIELVGKKGEVVWDYNCGGMFRAWIDEDGSPKCRIFRGESYESGPDD